MVDRGQKFVRDLTDQHIQGADALEALRRFASLDSHAAFSN